MTVTTALTAGKIYVVDWASGSDAGWTPDPEECDLDGKTEGVHYIVFDVTDQFRVTTAVDIDVDDNPSGFSYAIGLEERYEQVDLIVTQPTRATMKKIVKFMVTHSNTNTDNQTYMIIKHGSDDYETFFDADRTEQEYLRGWLTGKLERVHAAENRYYDVKISFRGVWE